MLNYKYDGGLSARLYSRSKNAVDDYDTHLQDETVPEEIYSNLAVVNYSVRNSSQKTVASGLKTLMLAMDVNASEPKNALLNAMLVVTAAESCVLTLTVDLNGTYLTPTARQLMPAGQPQTICLHNILDKIHQGENAITIWGETSAGTAVMETGDGVMTVSGQYMNAAEIINRPDYTATQIVPLFAIRRETLLPMFGEGDISVEIPDNNVTIGFTEEIAPFAIADRENITVSFTGTPSFPYEREWAYSSDFATVTLSFENPVKSDDISACAAAIAISFTDGTENYTYYAQSLSFVDGNTLCCVFPSFAAAISDITLSYIAQAGNLVTAYGETAINSFGVMVEVTA